MPHKYLYSLCISTHCWHCVQRTQQHRRYSSSSRAFASSEECPSISLPLRHDTWFGAVLCSSPTWAVRIGGSAPISSGTPLHWSPLAVSPAAWRYPRTPPSLSPTVHVLRCLAMLFFENSLPHFSHLLFPSVSALSPVHALLWLIRAFSDHRTKPNTPLNSYLSVPCILFWWILSPLFDLHLMPHPSILMFLSTSSPSLIFPLLLSYSSRCFILVETSSFHLPLSAARLPISVLSSPAYFISFLQYLTVFLFLPLVFSPSSNSSSQHSAATLVILLSSILMMCPILSHTLFSTFLLTVLIFTSFRMSCMLTPFLCISLSGARSYCSICI